ncbi:phosphonate C-P lyase system protein PhnH [Jiella sp. MQZ9-1]|uniref:Phosphonate C-P lyase system protein PhnH n=1 Tax=Jiella flava TaxID=2816857 RepID=A0A939FX55_9HYPH|nr:phosphonate C-P lyase system protein PhnH [Jiella flava]MBO0663135.1 phosphonate C-P lyase system protein PhnH [Jiella flava]MCD2471554.1 phosphonate C-P lyase system protein PhnH [Jiella flava]
MVTQDAAVATARTVEGGFADPVFDAQAVFAKLLAAMARPGTVVDLGDRCRPPEPLRQAQGAVLAAMADAATPVHVEAASDDLAAWLAFQTGARLRPIEEAAFAVVSTLRPMLLEALPLGTLQYPDRAATVLVEVDDLTAGDGFVLTGPGVDGVQTIHILGLDSGFTELRQRNRALFPCGFDLILTSGTRLMALPRSTVVERS